MEREEYVLKSFEKALGEGWVQVHYQPVVRTYTRRICGAEALARWMDPKEGMLSPGQFIPVLEKHKMMHRLDLCICEYIAKDIAFCRQQSIPFVPVSINISGKDFYETDMFAEVERILSMYAIDRDMIRIEIIEQGANKRDEVMDRAIDQFIGAGYQVWLDNFGKGSSFEALERYQYSLVKLDARFLEDAKDHSMMEKATAMLSYTVDMSKHMEIATLAENVETEEQFSILREMGVEMLQGYFFCKPIPFEEFLQQQDIFEDIEEGSYYEKIGQIELNHEGIAVTSFGKRGKEALAIMEYRDRRFYYLYQNEANRLYMQNIGIENEVEAENFLNQRSGMLQEKIRGFVRRMIAGERLVHLNFMMDSKVIDLWGDYIATNPKTGGIAMLIHKEELLDVERVDRAKKFDMALRNIYRIFDRFDLVRLSDGIITNSYVNTSEYGALHEGQDARSVMALYAAKYIVPEQKEEFSAFVALDSIVERFEMESVEYLSHNFDTRMDDGRILKKKYFIQKLVEERQVMILFGIGQGEGA